MRLRGAWGHEADDLARIHASAFSGGWSAADITALLNGPGGFALVVEEESPIAFILCRAIAGEAEILTLAVDPSVRRRGLARALVEAATGAARMAGAQSMFLEVAHDNAAAIGLYETTGFTRAGLRRGYYDRGPQGLADALVMRLDLGPGSL